MSQPPPQPPELPPGPASLSAGPPGLPPGPPPGPPPLPSAHPNMPAYQPPPATRSLASRPIFWILLVVGLLVFFAILAAGAFSGYRKVMKGVRAKQEEARQRIEKQVKQLEEEENRALQEESGTPPGKPDRDVNQGNDPQ